MSEVQPPDHWVIREGTVRGAGRYLWFHVGEQHETARYALSSSQSDADTFPSWEAAQDEVCNAGMTCRAVRVLRRPLRTNHGTDVITGVDPGAAGQPAYSVLADHAPVSAPLGVRSETTMPAPGEQK